MSLLAYQIQLDADRQARLASPRPGRRLFKIRHPRRVTCT
jgi:hypothetical protein